VRRPAHDGITAILDRSHTPFLHPAFSLAAEVSDLAALAAAEGVPGLQRWLDAAPVPVCNAAGVPLRLTDVRPASAVAFERAVFDQAVLSVRADTWHDRLNLLAWRLFPQTKARLNARHAAEEGDIGAGNRRTRVRDALTLFDEDGAVVAVSGPHLEAMVRNFEWKALFVACRQAVEDSLLCVPVGHALMEKLRLPHLGLTAKVLFVPVEAGFLSAPAVGRLARLDAAVAAAVAALRDPRDLAPLPVLGLPGWWPGGQGGDFYDNAAYFRSGRRGGGPGERRSAGDG